MKIFCKKEFDPRKVKDVKNDRTSDNPGWIDYNTMRKKIRLADQHGLKSFADVLCVAVHERLELDGYKIRRATKEEEVTLKNGWVCCQVIEWDKVRPSKFTKERDKWRGIVNSKTWKKKILTNDDELLDFFNNLTVKSILDFSKLVRNLDGSITIFYNYHKDL